MDGGPERKEQREGQVDGQGGLVMPLEMAVGRVLDCLEADKRRQYAVEQRDRWDVMVKEAMQESERANVALKALVSRENRTRVLELPNGRVAVVVYRQGLLRPDDYAATLEVVRIER